MIDKIKKIVGSRIFQSLLSLVLIYFAFRKVNVIKLVQELSMVPAWFVILMVLYSALNLIIGAYRWSLLLFDKPGKKEVINFSKSAFLGVFYALFFPSSVAGDVLKWVPLQKKYPNLSKATLLSSVLLDRIVGFTAFVVVATVAIIFGRLAGYSFPDFIFWLFMALFLGTVVFYTLVYSLDIEKILEPIPYLNKLIDIVELLKKENKIRLIKSIGVAFITEFLWMSTSWFISLSVKAGMSIVSIFVFVPVIALILLLPISFAGFGARENLYLFFFGQLGLNSEKILAVSAMNGVIGVLTSLIGGILTLF